MTTEARTWLIIAVISLVTALIRVAPFILFGGERRVPKWIERLGKMLPYSIMGMLVIYCLKDVRFTSLSGFLPELIAVILTGGLYAWRRNTLLSITVGTVSYMLLVQLVF